MKVAELRPYAKKVDLIVKVVSSGEAREVVSRLENAQHKVAEALVGDDTGCVLLTLWDDAIEKFETEKTYKIENAYCSFFKNSLRLNIGRYGEFEESSEEIKEVNKENNLSEKELTEK